jgi:hypothetical protein
MLHLCYTFTQRHFHCETVVESKDEAALQELDIRSAAGNTRRLAAQSFLFFTQRISRIAAPLVVIFQPGPRLHTKVHRQRTLRKRLPTPDVAEPMNVRKRQCN